MAIKDLKGDNLPKTVVEADYSLAKSTMNHRYEFRAATIWTVRWTSPVAALGYRKYLFESLPDSGRNDGVLLAGWSGAVWSSGFFSQKQVFQVIEINRGRDLVENVNNKILPSFEIGKGKV